MSLVGSVVIAIVSLVVPTGLYFAFNFSGSPDDSKMQIGIRSPFEPEYRKYLRSTLGYEKLEKFERDFKKVPEEIKEKAYDRLKGEVKKMSDRGIPLNERLVLICYLDCITHEYVIWNNEKVLRGENHGRQ